VQSFYTWFVFLHILAALGFVFAHGTTAFVAFRVRGEREPQRIAALLDLSNASVGLMYVSLLVLVMAGIAAGVIGSWFGQLWVWAAIVVLVLVTVAMFAYAVPYYERVRLAVGQPGRRSRAEAAPHLPREELAGLLDSRRPEGISVIGGVGLALIIWLMVFKPF
jgi:hypothetical protein